MEEKIDSIVPNIVACENLEQLGNAFAENLMVNTQNRIDSAMQDYAGALHREFLHATEVSETAKANWKLEMEEFSSNFRVRLQK